MNPTFLVCEFCDPNYFKTGDELTLTSSAFDHCSVCGINRDNCKPFAANVKFKKEQRYNQHTCMDNCSHRTCGNYTVTVYTQV